VRCGETVGDDFSKDLEGENRKGVTKEGEGFDEGETKKYLVIRPQWFVEGGG
jgi:hypothetical protein